jgi:hypothetical protein
MKTILKVLFVIIILVIITIMAYYLGNYTLDSFGDCLRARVINTFMGYLVIAVIAITSFGITFFTIELFNEIFDE